MSSNMSIRILGDCDQGVIPEFRFYSGEARTLKFQIYDVENDQKVCIPRTETGVTVTKTVTLPSKQSTDITIADSSITADANDRSVFSVNLSATDTANLITGWMKFSYTMVVTSPSSTTTRVAFREFAIKKLTV